MKLDKEALIKHKFWILLLVSVPISLAALFLLTTSVSGDIATRRTKIVADIKKYDNPPHAKTDADIHKAKLEADLEKSKEKKVWEEAYKQQDPLFRWPELVEEEFDFRSGLFAQKIKVFRGKAEPPPDGTKNDRVLHGIVTASRGSEIVVEDKDKHKYKFLPSVRLEKFITIEGDDNIKELSFGNIHVNDKVVVEFHRGKYFYEPLTDKELSTYRRNERTKGYFGQIDTLLEQVEPMTETGEGVVQLLNWFYRKGAAFNGELPPPGEQTFLTFMARGWAGAVGDISEQAWLAQEDIWVQHEIYRMVREANDYVSIFTKVDENDNGEDQGKEHVFKNPYWEMGLKWTGGTNLTIKLKNLQQRRQKLDVKFRIRFTKDKAPETIEIPGEPLGPVGTQKGEVTIPYVLKENLGRKGIFGVEQVLTWETAAVKRIDQVSVGSLAPGELSHSHRTFAYDQVALKMKDPTITAPPPPPVPTRPGRGLKGPKDNGGNDLTPYGLIRNRYAEVTSNLSRRIPVSVALIVDQDHIDRVMTAFSNSKLRFLTTQVLLNTYTASIKPQLPTPAALGGGPPNPRFRPPPPPPPTDDLETNMELVLYGIMTLYERYPPPLP